MFISKRFGWVVVIGVLITVSLSMPIWASIGVPGGTVRSIVIDPANEDHLYVGTTMGGVYRSTNAGGRWSEFGEGLEQRTVFALVMDPYARVLYAATDAGVYEGSIAQPRWQRTLVFTASDVGITTAVALALAPGRPATIYVASPETGVLRKRAGAIAWERVHEGLPSMVFSLAADTQGAVYAGGPGGRVYQRPRGARRWQPTSEGGPVGNVGALAVDARTLTLYAGAENGVFEYAGAGWQSLALPAGPARHIVVAPQPDSDSARDGYRDRLYVSVEAWDTEFPFRYQPRLFVGIDRLGELVWSDLQIPRSMSQNVTALAVQSRPRSQIRLYAGVSDRGLLVSDNGSDWVAMNTGLHNQTVYTVAPGPAPGAVYAGGLEGLFVQQATGTGWLNTMPRGGIWNIAPVPDNPSTVYASAFALFYRSTNGGVTWSGIGRVAADGSWDLIVAPQERLVLTVGYGKVYRYNGPYQWVDTHFPEYPYYATTVLVDPATLNGYAGTMGQGMFRSEDLSRGGAWEPWSTPGCANPFIRSLARDDKSGALFAGTHDGVCKLEPGAAQWTLLPPFGDDKVALALAVDPNTGVLVAATRNAGIYAWDGELWQAGIGLTNPRILSLAVDPRTQPSTIYAGTAGNGLFASTDGGRTWH